MPASRPTASLSALVPDRQLLLHFEGEDVRQTWDNSGLRLDFCHWENSDRAGMQQNMREIADRHGILSPKLS